MEDRNPRCRLRSAGLATDWEGNPPRRSEGSEERVFLVNANACTMAHKPSPAGLDRVKPAFIEPLESAHAS